MANLIFYDATHTYTVDGEEIPSVSELTRFISREVYQDVTQFRLDAAADRGTRVHKAAEALDKFGEVEVDDEAAPYLQAYVKFRKEHSPDWEKVEWPVCYQKLYAGTIDRYGTMDGRHVIVDLKTTASIDRKHKVLYTAAQNLYRIAAAEAVPVDALYILQLTKDGEYKLIELPIDDELPRACLALHEALKPVKRKKKGDKPNG